MTDGPIDTDKYSVEELIRLRNLIETTISQKSKRITIVFTDIKGYTDFVDRFGDLSGRSLIVTHNDILFPLIRTHNGTVVKTIGDAIMAFFEEPEDALSAAMAMQKELAAFNARRKPDAQIHVRIGINYGIGIVEDTDIFGDVVNIASRIEALADGDQIFVSGDVYSEVGDELRGRCVYVGMRHIKGKKEPVNIYEVHWSSQPAGGAGNKRVAPLNRLHSQDSTLENADHSQTRTVRFLRAPEHGQENELVGSLPVLYITIDNDLKVSTSSELYMRFFRTGILTERTGTNWRIVQYGSSMYGLGRLLHLDMHKEAGLTCFPQSFLYDLGKRVSNLVIENKAAKLVIDCSAFCTDDESFSRSMKSFLSGIARMFRSAEAAIAETVFYLRGAEGCLDQLAVALEAVRQSFDDIQILVQLART